MPDETKESANLNNEDANDKELASEYALGELAPCIVTPNKTWKPDDLKKENNTICKLLEGLVHACSNSEESPRLYSITQCWQARHFDRGYQFLTEGPNGGWNIAGTNVTQGRNPIASSDAANLYATNIYSAQGEIITGALNRGSIKVNFAPAKSKDPQDELCAKEANKYKHIWYQANDSVGLQREVSGYFWTDPRVILWTRSIKDKSRFGLTTSGKEVRTVEVTTAHGMLETKLPMMKDNLNECDYAQIFEEIDYARARAMFPWMGKNISISAGGGGELAFERLARINTRLGTVGRYLSGTADYRMTTIGYTWLRPSMYWDDSVNSTQRAFLLENFPTGILITIAGDKLVCCWEESMDDHLSLGICSRGFGQNRRALGSSDIDIQKRINIWFDLYDKFATKSIPSTLLDDQAFNTEAVSELEATPGRFIPVTLSETQTMQSVVGQTPVPTPIPDFSQMLQYNLGPLIQSIDGATPALFGGGEGQDNTVGATQIRLNQALERVGPTWMVMNKMFEDALSQAVKCCAENGNEPIDYSGSDGDLTVDPNNLKGNFRCESETINTIPESGTQKKAEMFSVLDMAASNPTIAAAIAKPSNSREIVRALNIDFDIDEANWEDYAMENIKLLLDSEPLINPDYVELNEKIQSLNTMHELAKQTASEAVATGNVLTDEVIQQGDSLETELKSLQDQIANIPQYLPSIQIAQDESEDHLTISDTILAWMGEPDGRNLRRLSNEEDESGDNWKKWTNVYLYWKGQKDMAKKIIADNQQPLAPKVSLSSKNLPSKAIQELLAAAGIQTTEADYNTGQPTEQHTETIQRTPTSEVKTKTIRRL